MPIEGKVSIRRTPEEIMGWLDEQEFYEYCQAYRHAPVTDQDVVVAQFEALKRYIRKQIILGIEPPKPGEK